jgi:hypothetical protein
VSFIKILSHMLTNRLLDQASDDAIEDRKKEKFITFSEFARSLPPCAARDLIEREQQELFTDDDL